MELKPGVRVGAGLRLVRQLGSGAMGSVWEAQRPDEGGRVAVKFASKQILKDPTDRARFSREATLANQLESKHVVENQGFGIDPDGTPYIVMELLKGETLADRLRRERVVGPAELVKILRQMADALDEAHGLGIIHRDVKPDNVFLAKMGDTTMVKMLDFGMAKRTNVPNPSVVTEEGTSVGTPDFMAPEQLRNPNKIDHRADIWAIGVLSYRSLIGNLPFVSTTFAGLCMAITEGRYTTPSELAPFLPVDVDRWFTKVLAVDPDDRYDSAAEAVAGLSRALALEPGGPDTKRGKAMEAPKRDRAPSGADSYRAPVEDPSRYRFLDLAIAVLVGFTAVCLGALIASMDGF